MPTRPRPAAARPVARPAAALAAAAVLCAACASSRAQEEAGSTGANVAVPVRIETPESRATTLNIVPTTTEASATMVDATPDKAWSALADAYGELALRPTQISSSDYVLAVDNARLRRQLGGQPISRFLDCGMGQSGQNANLYEVTLNLKSQLRPVQEKRTEVRTLLTASARPVAVSGTAVQCQTTNLLEQRIAAMVQAKTAGR